MKVLFEKYHYDKLLSLDNEKISLSKVLAEGGVIAKHVESDTKLSIDYVGYFYSQHLKDCVFILPKVLVKEDDTILDENIKPDDIISIDSKASTDSPDGKLSKKIQDFIYEFSVWVYRAIDVYRHRNPDSDIAVNPEITQMGRGRRRDRYTLVDIMLALIDFNRNNQDYLTFVLRNVHSGNNKINWTKTIAKNNVIVQSGTPVYISPVNRKKQINYDEELLIIFYSILNYIHEKYNFPVLLNAYFDLIKGKRFQQYIKGMGKRRLKQIKYKYFSDRDLAMWDSCYAFFDHAYKVAIQCDVHDYLLVHSFHAVFEDMIDELLSDKDQEIKKMKMQEDNKRLDHLYRYYGLTEDEKKVFYIGDSKYYPLGASIPETSVAKQYTYARNLVQYDMDLFNSEKEEERKKALGYRDEVTEGYDIVPNFFISAQINDVSEKGYKDDKIERMPIGDDKRFHISCHFKNRLYDRDTILVSHYNVNFLYVLALYAKNRSSEQKGWSEKVKARFRAEIIDGLNEEFNFYAMTPHADVDSEQYIKDNFKSVLGKVFSPFANKNNQQFYSLALRNPDCIKEEQQKAEIEDENEAILFQLRNAFYVQPCDLGKSPYEVLPPVTPQLHVAIPNSFLTMHYLENYSDTSFLIGVVNDSDHESWIFGREGGKRDDAYNVRIGKDVPGGVVKSRDEIKHAKFVILYRNGEEDLGIFKSFRVKNIGELTKEQMIKTGYKNPKHEKYLCYFFDEEVNLGDFDVEGIINYDYFYKSNQQSDRVYPQGKPIYLQGKELIKFRKPLDSHSR